MNFCISRIKYYCKVERKRGNAKKIGSYYSNFREKLVYIDSNGFSVTGDKR